MSQNWWSTTLISLILIAYMAFCILKHPVMPIFSNKIYIIYIGSWWVHRWSRLIIWRMKLYSCILVLFLLISSGIITISILVECFFFLCKIQNACNEFFSFKLRKCVLHMWYIVSDKIIKYYFFNISLNCFFLVMFFFLKILIIFPSNFSIENNIEFFWFIMKNTKLLISNYF